MISEIVAWALERLEPFLATPSFARPAGTLLRGRNGLSTGGDILQRIQRIRLTRTIRYAYHHSPFYQRCLDAAEVSLDEVGTPEVFRQLPFTTSDDLHDWESFLCVPKSALSAVFTTSGTTGEPK